jgi:hypothetical protein
MLYSICSTQKFEANMKTDSPQSEYTYETKPSSKTSDKIPTSFWMSKHFYAVKWAAYSGLSFWTGRGEVSGLKIGSCLPILVADYRSSCSAFFFHLLFSYQLAGTATLTPDPVPHDDFVSSPQNWVNLPPVWLRYNIELRFELQTTQSSCLKFWFIVRCN